MPHHFCAAKHHWHSATSIARYGNTVVADTTAATLCGRVFFFAITALASSHILIRNRIYFGGTGINIDKNILSSFASLDDASLLAAIKMIAAQSGVDMGGIGFDVSKLSALREAMKGATDSDIAMLKNLFNDGKGKK